jgi:hypothetical protein
MTTQTSSPGQQIATTILSQLGGTNKLSAMINAKNFIHDNNSLTFQFSGNKKINYITIELNSLDLYNVTFKKFTAGRLTKSYDWIDPKWKTVTEYNNVYAEQLKELIERETGLYLSL